MIENENPFVENGLSFGVNNVVSFALAPTNNVAMAGGLGDTGVDSTLDSFVPEVWGQSIMDYMEKNLVFGALANDLSGLVANGGDLIHLPKQTEITASDTYGGATAAVETLIDTPLAFDDSTAKEDSYTLTLNQAIHTAIAFTDVAKVQTGYDVMNMYTSKMGYALAKKIDQYLSLQLLNHVGFNHSNGTDDGAGAGNTIELNTTHDSYDIIKAGVSNLIEAVHTNDANLEDYTAIMTPKCYASLFKLDDFSRYDVIGNSLGQELPRVSGFAGKLAGVDVVVSNNFTSWDAGAATTSSNGTPIGNFSANGVTDESEKLLGFLVHKDAMHIAYSPGMKARVQSDYHLPTLSTRFVADSVYGCLVTGSTTAGNKKVFALVSPAS